MSQSLTICLILMALIATGQEKNLQYYYSQAREAQKSGDHATFHEMISKANELHPYHQGIMYYRGLAAALTNRPEESIQFLREAILIDATYNLQTEELKSLSPHTDFKALLQLQEKLKQSTIHADTAWIMRDRTLHPESVAAGEKNGVYYLSSVHRRKIVKVDQKRNVTDFTTPAQDGMTSVLGIKVDQSKKVLWACSSPMKEMQNYDTIASAAVFKYNLETGKLLAKYSPEIEKQGFSFGDLLLNKHGEAFISDSQNNIVFKVNEATGKLEVYFTSDEFWNIQGIAFSENEEFLFISDYIKGIYRLNTKTKELIQLMREPLVSLKSVDGLHWYKNSLIAIQNGVKPMRVMRYILNPTLDKVVNYQVIDHNHPAFNEPTNGCIIGDTFYYVANSQWGGYDDQHNLKPVDQLQDIIILKADLSKLK